MPPSTISRRANTPQLSLCVPVDEEALRPLLDAKDDSLVSLARQILTFVRYDEGKWDPAHVTFASTADSQRIVHDAGPYDTWRMVAMERGFDLDLAADPADIILQLVADSRRRIERLEQDAVTRKMGPTELLHWQSREWMLQMNALDALVASQGKKAFDPLVAVLDSEGGVVGGHAAALLSELFPQRFPVSGIVVRGNACNGVLPYHQAAAAWRAWRKTFGDKELPSANAAKVDREKRLQEFERNRRFERSGGEFARPTEEVLTELLAERDTRFLAMLAEVLSTKTLTDDQVRTLVEAARKDDSEAHRLYLWQVLFGSRSSVAFAYLQEALGPHAPEESVLEFVHAIRSLREAQAELMTGIVRAPAVPVDRIDAVRAAMLLPGVNELGYRLVQLALDEEKEPVRRGELHAIAIARGGSHALTKLLHSNEPDDVKLAGLAAFKVDEEHFRTFGLHDGEIDALRGVADSGTSEKLKAAAAALLARLESLQKEHDSERRRR